MSGGEGEGGGGEGGWWGEGGGWGGGMRVRAGWWGEGEGGVVGGVRAIPVDKFLLFTNLPRTWSC